MKIFVMGAALRRESFNRRLAAVATHIAASRNTDVTVGEFHSFAMPLYDGDVETEAGMPDSAKMLSGIIKDADGLIFAVPEYNNSVAGPFKNALDWLSREKPYPTTGKPVLLLSASSGKGAGMLGIAATRVPLSFMRAHVYPTGFGLGNAGSAFDDDRGRLKDDKLQQQLEALIEEFLAFVKRLSASSP